MTARRVRRAGDSALIVDLAPRFSLEANREATALAAILDARRIAGVRDVVVTGASLTVYFDPLTTREADLLAVLRQPVAPGAGAAAEVEPVLIPVTYGGEGGPDLAEVARRCGCTPEEVVSRHSAVTYRAIMMGFVPGFAYLWPLDERLRLPRRPTPRTRVPAGSVALAGPQTAVYPSDTPGGWHLIGRTDVRLFDLGRPQPFLLETGCTVRFVPQ